MTLFGVSVISEDISFFQKLQIIFYLLRVKWYLRNATPEQFEQFRVSLEEYVRERNKINEKEKV